MNFFRPSTVPVPGAKFNHAMLVGGAAGLSGDDLQPAPVGASGLPVHPLLADPGLLTRVCGGQQVGGVVLLEGTIAGAHKGFGGGRGLTINKRVATLGKGFAGATGAQWLRHKRFPNNKGRAQ